MLKAYTLQSSSNMAHTSDALLSSPSSPLPMSNEVNASTPCPPLSYCHDNPKANDALINKATTRLRCRLLEQGLIDAKTKVSHLQAELDNLRIELSTTENVLSKFGEPDDRQLLALERRFNTHQQQLDLLLSTSTQESQPQPKPQLPENAITASTSFSSTLSRMSSIFSARQKPFKKTIQPSVAPSGPYQQQQHSDSSVTNDTCSTTSDYDNSHRSPSDVDARERRMRRRQRVKQLRQEYQQRLRIYDPTWNDKGEHDWRPAPPSVDDDKSIPEQDEEPATATTSLVPAPAPTQHEQQQKSSPKKQQEQPPTTTGKKRMVAKQAPNATKKPMMTSTKPIQSKPAAAPCLCKRKTTNKADPIKAASSPTYHSKQQPEKVLLETHKQQQQQPHHPLSPQTSPTTAAKDETAHTTTAPPPPLDTHVLASLPPANDNEPPMSSNVCDWVLKQRQYHLEHQQQYNDNDDDSHEDDKQGAWMEKETLIDNQPRTIGNNNDDEDDNDSMMMKPLPRRMIQSSNSVFDDVLRYLDTMSDFGNDSGLQQDISHLLDNPHPPAPPSLCSSISSSLSWSTLRSQALPTSSLLTHHGLVGKYCSRYLVDGVNKSLSWCKFLSVLSLALVISLGRGPDHMLLSLDDLDYLDLMADQGDEPLVYSYYL